MTDTQKIQLRAKMLQSSPTVQKLHQVLGASIEVEQGGKPIVYLDALLSKLVCSAFTLHYLRTFSLEGLEMMPILEEIPLQYGGPAELPDNAQVKAFLSSVFERLKALNLQEFNLSKLELKR
ncbi:hypothetical protein [Helicobacter felis]|uniref:Uncharacterized protein n=1 Tax=Helicobacter felis (strain ATCC 49179 / CCUG 28539 / NCTC 12436 / CS1) TaxID=936155 RepID=E7AC53_HELFC|nr:hypothetical protein [Helicobacter felis]CBY82135.1 unnamed protein product [Helicobacter felis ATCC 49179]